MPPITALSRHLTAWQRVEHLRLVLQYHVAHFIQLWGGGIAHVLGCVSTRERHSILYQSVDCDTTKMSETGMSCLTFLYLSLKSVSCFAFVCIKRLTDLFLSWGGGTSGEVAKKMSWYAEESAGSDLGDWKVSEVVDEFGQILHQSSVLSDNYFWLFPKDFVDDTGNSCN